VTAGRPANDGAPRGGGNHEMCRARAHAYGLVLRSCTVPPSSDGGASPEPRHGDTNTPMATASSPRSRPALPLSCAAVYMHGFPAIYHLCKRTIFLAGKPAAHFNGRSSNNKQHGALAFRSTCTGYFATLTITKGWKHNCFGVDPALIS
jgi:hypothetical protein